jgi:UDP:flavonoid glycosyltransferase YjiC (YdhE family)
VPGDPDSLVADGVRHHVPMRVAVVAGGDPGHVFPAAGLTAALTARGHDAVLCTVGQWLPALARDGIPAVAMPLPPPNDDPDGVRRLRATSRRLAAPLAGVLAPFAPELVVSDVMTPAGALAAGLLGTSWVQLVPHPLQDPSPHLPPSGSGLWPARGPLGRARDRRLYRITSGQWRQGERENDAERARLGLPPGGRPAARLVAALPALEVPRPDWPADAHLVGPLEWDPAVAELTPPPGDGPLVLLSATTVAGAVSGLAAATLAGLEGTGTRVAWTLLDPPDATLPPWVAAGPGRQAPLIDAADVVVCGGGHGILAKALGRGRPVVTVPGGGEQRENADRVRRGGLGVRIPAARLTPARLRTAVMTVLADPGYQARAARAIPAATRSPGDRAVDVVERVAEATLGRRDDVAAGGRARP